MAQQIFKQPGLRAFHQLRHGNGGIDIRHRVVGIAVLDAVGARQVFQPEAGQPFLIFRPVNALRTQGVACPHDVEQIPARVAVLPAPGIGIVEVAIENVARYFVIETDVVVTDHAGIGDGKEIVDAAGEFCLVNAFFPRFLRGDAGDHNRPGLRQVVISRFTVKDLGLANNVELVVGADGGKLRRPVQRRVRAKGFVVVK